MLQRDDFFFEQAVIIVRKAVCVHISVYTAVQSCVSKPLKHYMNCLCFVGVKKLCILVSQPGFCRLQTTVMNQKLTHFFK